ncbi:MAG: SRPBCC domain-containing protein, partial [Lysobacterales bacterium]
MNIEPANLSSITLQVSIDSSVSEVWKALTENISDWWPADFYAGGTEGQRSYLLEAFPGGRMYESWGENGGGVLWGNVVTVDPAKRLEILGSVFPSFGGPNQWFGTWDLEAKGEQGCLLTFSENSLGLVSVKGTEDRDTGWTYLWNTMKAHIEGKPAPGWP